MVKKNVASSSSSTHTPHTQTHTLTHTLSHLATLWYRLPTLSSLYCRCGCCGSSSSQLTLLKGEHCHRTRENCHNVFTRSSARGRGDVRGGGKGCWGRQRLPALCCWSWGNTIMTSFTGNSSPSLTNQNAAQLRLLQEREKTRERVRESAVGCLSFYLSLAHSLITHSLRLPMAPTLMC